MPPQFIYTMKGLGKVHPPDHVVLKDIWLSFLPGAKIGVLGLNGAGKSSLLKIMAGVDQEFIGEAWLGKGHTVGYLEQEPKLDETRTVKQIAGRLPARNYKFSALVLEIVNSLPFQRQRASGAGVEGPTPNERAGGPAGRSPPAHKRGTSP